MEIYIKKKEMVTFLKLTSLQNYIFITLEEKENKDNRKWVNNKSSRGKPMLAISFKMEFLQGVTISIEIHTKPKKNYLLLLKVVLKKNQSVKLENNSLWKISFSSSI